MDRRSAAFGWGRRSDAFRGVGGGAAFDPANLAGLVLDLDVDRGVTTAGGTVSAWADQSGSGFDFTQATAASRPAHGNTPPRYVDFDGTDDYLTNSSVIASGAWTIAARFKLDVVPGSGQFQFLCALVQSATRTFAEIGVFNFAGYQNVSFLAKSSSTATASSGFNPTLNTSEHRLIVTYNNGTNSTPGSYTAKYDGADQTVVASGNFSPTATNLGCVAARASNTGTPSFMLNGRLLKRFLVYNRALSAAERTQLDTWLAA